MSMQCELGGYRGSSRRAPSHDAVTAAATTSAAPLCRVKGWVGDCRSQRCSFDQRNACGNNIHGDH